MAVTKVLARDWKKQILAGGNYVEIKGIRSFTVATTKQDADTSDFESQGWNTHLVAARGMTLTLEGFYMESATATAAYLQTNLLGANNDMLFTCVNTGTAGNSIRVKYVVSGSNTPLSVTVSGNDVTVNVATGAGGAATSIASAVKAAIEAATDPTAGELVITYPTGNDGTGIVTAMDWSYLSQGAVSGGRDAGQAYVEALSRVVGPSSIGTFRLITPGGTRWDFTGSCEVSGPGGDTNAVADWKVTLTVSGQVSIT